MESEKISASIQLKILEQEYQKDVSKLLKFFGRAMLNELVENSPEINQSFPNGSTWTMRLVNKNVLEVSLPLNETNLIHFTQLTQENWGGFVANIKAYNLENEVVQMIPELAGVKFKNQVVKIPRTLNLSDAVIIVACDRQGMFLPQVFSLDNLANGYAKQAKTTADSAN